MAIGTDQAEVEAGCGLVPRMVSARMPSPTVVTLARDRRVVASRCVVADRPWSRLRGLLGRRSLADGEGLLIVPAASIHTVGMRFAIDALFLDRAGVVLATVEDLRPWCMAGCRGAKAVLELPAGSARRAGVGDGDMLRFAATGA